MSSYYFVCDELDLFSVGGHQVELGKALCEVLDESDRKDQKMANVGRDGRMQLITAFLIIFFFIANKKITFFRPK